MQTTTEQQRTPYFVDPYTVVRYAPCSGVFGTDKYVGDLDGFVDRIIGKWYNIPGNTLVVEPEIHREATENLYPLYIRIRQNRNRLTQAQAGLVLSTLNKTGSIKKGLQVLDAALALSEPAPAVSAEDATRAVGTTETTGP